MAIWVKKNGKEIELNDNPATIAYAEEFGWAKKGEEKPKRKRRTKAEMEEERKNSES